MPGDVGTGGDDVAADTNADRAGTLSDGLESTASSAVWCDRDDRIPEREAWMWPSAWAGTWGLVLRTMSEVRIVVTGESLRSNGICGDGEGSSDSVGGPDRVRRRGQGI